MGGREEKPERGGKTGEERESGAKDRKSVV